MTGAKTVVREGAQRRLWMLRFLPPLQMFPQKKIWREENVTQEC
jgi:hypothetical protein